jgi:hypothetical protein
MHLRRLAVEALRQRGCGVDDMLAVVEDQQNPATREKGHETGKRILRLYEDAQHSGYSAGNKGRVGDGAEIYEVHGLAELVQQGVSDGDGHGRLAHAAGTHHADKAWEVSNVDKVSTAPLRPIMRASRAGSLYFGPGRLGRRRKATSMAAPISRTTGATKQ